MKNCIKKQLHYTVMRENMVDIKSVIYKYPECLKDKSKLKAYLSDLYPDNSDKPYIHLICLVNDLGIRKLDQNQAQKYDINKDDFEEADVDSNGLDIDEILQSDLYEQFATLYVESKEDKDNTKDAEKEKEEQEKVDKKGGSGAA